MDKQLLIELIPFDININYRQERPDDSGLNYPFMAAFYKPNNPRPNKKGKIVNPHSLAIVLITNLADLMSNNRVLSHKGYSKIVMMFEPSDLVQGDDKNNRYIIHKFSTWSNLKPYVIPKEAFLCDVLEETNPSHLIGQLTLAL